jgi:AcrR family transcriptional regulator
MPRIKKEPKAERRNVQGEKSRLIILRVAASLFAQRGYDDVSIRDIADAVNTVPSLIMHHFGSKAALYRKTVNYYLGDGEIFMRGTEPLTRIQEGDKQGAANALAESIHLFFEFWHGPHRVKHLDRLLLQVIFGRGAVDVPLALDWIRPSEKIFEDFFLRVANLTPTEADIRMEIFFSHIFYPAVIRSLLLVEHDWDDYPEEFLLSWERTIAKDFCRGLDLPDPILNKETEKYHKHSNISKRGDLHSHGATSSAPAPLHQTDATGTTNVSYPSKDPRYTSDSFHSPSPASTSTTAIPPIFPTGNPFTRHPSPPVPPQ